MLFTADAAKGNASVNLPWQQIQQQRMQELTAFNEQMNQEALFQKQEQATQAEIYKQIAEQGKANFLPGDQQRFRAKYDELKNNLMKKIEGYSSIQAFMANEGAEALSSFSNELLGSDEFSNGLQNTVEFEMYKRQVDAGKLYHKMGGVDAEGNAYEFNSPAEAYNALEQGKISRLKYNGAYENEFDSSKLFIDFAENDEFVTKDELERELENQNVAPQVRKRVLADYTAKKGNGYYKFKRSPGLDIQRTNAQANLYRAAAQKSRTNNYWEDLFTTGGVQDYNFETVVYGNQGPQTIKYPVAASNVNDAVSIRPEYFGLKKLEVTSATEKDQGGKTTNNKGEGNAYKIASMGDMDLILSRLSKKKSVLSKEGPYGHLKPAIFNIANQLGVVPAVVMWDTETVTDESGAKVRRVKTTGDMVAKVVYDEKRARELVVNYYKEKSGKPNHDLTQEELNEGRIIIAMLKKGATEGFYTGRINANEASGKQLYDLKNIKGDSENTNQFLTEGE